MNAAAKRPPAVDKITTIDGFRGTISRLDRAGDDRYATAKHPARRFRGEKRTSKRSRIGDDPKVQPTEPSIRDSASVTSMTVSGSASQPPSSCTQIKRNRLVWRTALIIGSTSRPSCSDWLAYSR